jgi:hypothetical protein
MAADFPLPLAAVSATVDFRVFSEIASKKDRTALAWSNVFASETKFPTLGVSSKEACAVWLCSISELRQGPINCLACLRLLLHIPLSR